MKRLSNIWPNVISFENLYAAYRAARRGKSRRSDVAGFALRLEHNLWELHAGLRDGNYRPGRYRQFTVYEKKPRVISAAPFVDRVVHHAVMRYIEPPLDRKFIFDSYACRRGRGVLAAIDRYQTWARRYTYVTKLDIRQYFPSIDHEILLAALERRISDLRVLELLRLVVAASPPTTVQPRYFSGDDLLSALCRRTGIPIGNLTSQFFANLYLDDFDHLVKDDWRIPGYLRYVDDMVFLDDDAGRLREVAAFTAEQLARLRVTLHPGLPHVRRTSEKINLLGYQVSRHRRWLSAVNGHRFARRLRQLAAEEAQGRRTRADARARIQAWIGHARHGETWGLRKSLFQGVTLGRGSGRD